jgi:hypothetical protein
MKKEDTPQDKSALRDLTTEIYYVKNNDGTYGTALSTGWEVKTEALDNAWKGINEKAEEARISVERGLKSPIFYYMVKNIMTISLLSSYVKFNKLRVWWHLHPGVYKKLSTSILQRYAKVFNIDPGKLDTLK